MNGRSDMCRSGRCILLLLEGLEKHIRRVICISTITVGCDWRDDLQYVCILGSGAILLIGLATWIEAVLAKPCDDSEFAHKRISSKCPGPTVIDAHASIDRPQKLTPDRGRSNKLGL